MSKMCTDTTNMISKRNVILSMRQQPNNAIKTIIIYTMNV